MTASAATPAHPRKPTARPSLGRQMAALYLDALACSFVSWVVCFSLGLQSHWASLALFLWVAEFILCRNRLHPTAGEFCLGIRYLTSSSSQVVADIQVIHAKLRLNPFLLAGGVVEFTLALAFLCGWTFLPKAVFWGLALEPPFSLAYWVAAGLAFFVCGGTTLSGSKNALWAVPAIHAWFILDIFKSYPAWEALVRIGGDHILRMPAWLEDLSKPEAAFLPLLFLCWSLFLAGSLFLSRRHLVN